MSKTSIPRSTAGAAFVVLASCLMGQVVPAPADLTAPRLKSHATLPQNDPPGVPLSELLSQGQALAASKSLTSSSGIENTIFDEPGDVSGLNADSVSALYRRRTCGAGAIVIGKTTAWQYHLSASGAAVYADYDFVVETVLKNNPVAPVTSAKDIIVTRPGGSMTLGSGSFNQVTFTHQAFPQLQPGAKYLMFLSFIPATGAYQAIDAFSTLVAGDANWGMARRVYSTLYYPFLTRGSFETSIKQWITSCGG